MWYEVENGEAVRPSEVDQTSSADYIYVRRSIELVEATGEGEDERPAHYEWEETRIPRDAWEIYLQAEDNRTALDDVYDALIELAEA